MRAKHEQVRLIYGPRAGDIVTVHAGVRFAIRGFLGPSTGMARGVHDAVYERVAPGLFQFRRYDGGAVFKALVEDW